MKYAVTVKPGSSQEKVVESEDTGELTVYLHARAHDGEANIALIGLLAKYFGVAKSKIMILRGAKSRHKLVRVEPDY